MNRKERRATVKDPNVLPMPQAVASEARTLLARLQEKARALGELDMAMARLEVQRAQARQEAFREEQELNAVLQKEAQRQGIAAGPERWTADVPGGAFRRAP